MYIIYIRRNINDLTESGFCHYLRIVNANNIAFFSNQFKFSIDQSNQSFDPNEVYICIRLWVLNAYNKIKSIKCSKIEIDYCNDINFKIINRIIEDISSYDYFKITRPKNVNEYSKSAYEKYKNYCKSLYNSNKSGSLIDFETFLRINESVR